MNTNRPRGKSTPASTPGSFTTHTHGAADVDLDDQEFLDHMDALHDAADGVVSGWSDEQQIAFLRRLNVSEEEIQQASLETASGQDEFALDELARDHAHRIASEHVNAGGDTASVERAMNGEAAPTCTTCGKPIQDNEATVWTNRGTAPHHAYHPAVGGSPVATETLDRAALPADTADYGPGRGDPDAPGPDEITCAKCGYLAVEHGHGQTSAYGLCPGIGGTPWPDAKQAEGLKVGDRILVSGMSSPNTNLATITYDEEDYVVVSRVGRNSRGAVLVWVDGSTYAEPTIEYPSDRRIPTVAEAPVDWSDPDDFDAEVERRVAQRVKIAYAVDWTPEAIKEARREERIRLHRGTQPSNISPLALDRLGDPTVPNGRAKVGDNVIYSDAANPDSAYEVIGKAPRSDLLGHDGTRVVWADHPTEVEYTLKDLRTGTITTSDLRQAGWRRIPAPGDGR